MTKEFVIMNNSLSISEPATFLSMSWILTSTNRIVNVNDVELFGPRMRVNFCPHIPAHFFDRVIGTVQLKLPVHGGPPWTPLEPDHHGGGHRINFLKKIKKIYVYFLLPFPVCHFISKLWLWIIFLNTVGAIS